MSCENAAQSSPSGGGCAAFLPNAFQKSAVEKNETIFVLSFLKNYPPSVQALITWPLGSADHHHLGTFIFFENNCWTNQLIGQRGHLKVEKSKI